MTGSKGSAPARVYLPPTRLSRMSSQPSTDDVTARARELLDSRVKTVREAVTHQHRIDELRTQLDIAERDYRASHKTALSEGWRPDELRKLGLPDPASTKTRRTRRKTTNASSSTTPTPMTQPEHNQDSGDA